MLSDCCGSEVPGGGLKTLGREPLQADHSHPSEHTAGSGAASRAGFMRLCTCKGTEVGLTLNSVTETRPFHVALGAANYIAD